MASSVSPSLSASQTESQSSRGPNITHWLPQLMLGALLAVGGASIIGLALSAVAFARPEEELVKRGHGVAQCFVLFASMLSLFYIPLHILATLKGESLYPQIPLLHAQILPRSFRHELHAWASMAIQIAVVMWATAIIPVAVGIHRGPDARSTVHLKVDMFVCATGLVFSAILLVVVKVAERPFCLPWLSRKPAREEDNNTTRDFDSLKFEKQSSVGDNTSEEGSSTTSGSPRSPRSIHDAPSITTGSASVTATTASRSSSSARVLRTTRHRTKGGEGCSGSHRRSPRRCIWPTYASQAHPHHPQAVPLAMPVPVPMAMPMPMEMPIGIATMGIPIQPQRARASSCSSTAASTLETSSNTGSSSGDITPATSVCPSTVGDPPPSDVGSGGGKEGNDKSATAPGPPPPPPPPDAVTQSRPLPSFGGSTSSSSGQESVTATASSEVSGQPARKKPRLMTSRDPMGRGGGGAPGWTGWGWYTAAGQASVGGGGGGCGGGDHPAPLMDRGRGKLVHPPPPPPPPPAGRRPGPPGPRGVERESPLVIRFRRKAGTTHPPGGAGTSVPEPQKRVEAERGKEGEKSGGEKKDEKYLKQQEGGNDDGETVKGSEDKGGKSDGPSAADQAQQKVYWVPGGWLPQGVLAEEEN